MMQDEAYLMLTVRVAAAAAAPSSDLLPIPFATAPAVPWSLETVFLPQPKQPLSPSASLMQLQWQLQTAA